MNIYGNTHPGLQLQEYSAAEPDTHLARNRQLASMHGRHGLPHAPGEYSGYTCPAFSGTTTYPDPAQRCARGGYGRKTNGTPASGINHYRAIK